MADHRNEWHSLHKMQRSFGGIFKGQSVTGASDSDLKEHRSRVASGHTPSVVSSRYSVGEEPGLGPLYLISKVPGVVVLCGWISVYVPTIAALNWSLGSCRSVKATSIVSLPAEEFIMIAGLCVFSVCVFIDLISTAMQVSPKKRQLSSIILFINTVCVFVYCTMVFGFVPVIRDADGNEITSYVMHLFEWSFTTPSMIIVLDALSTPMRNSVVSDWNSVGFTLFFDELMLFFGFLTLYFPGGTVAHLSFWLSTFCFAVTCFSIHRCVQKSIEKCDTTFEVSSIRYLEIATYIVWTCFPVVHLLMMGGWITEVQHSLARVFCDVLAKTIYSVALLSGNFCLLDTIAELRLLQMREAQDSKTSKILKAEKMNEALQVQVMEAETSARLSRRFLANVSHELRTPLNSVINFNSLLMDAGLQQAHQEYVSSALTSAQALLGVINQVLDFSKLDATDPVGIRLEMQPFYFSSLLEDVEDIIASRVTERDVDFKVSCPLKAPCLVGDSFRIRQCLINLTDNAIKFANPKGGEVCVSVQLEPDEDQGFIKVSIAVWDNGPGIPEEKQNLLFKPFSQIESSYSRQHQGTGLGLAITKRILEAMNGTISCISKEGHGTNFAAEFILSVCDKDDALEEPMYSSTPLDGNVVLCMNPSLASDMIKKSCLFFGLSLKDQTVNHDKVQEFVANFIRTPRIEVMILDYESFLQVRQASPAISTLKLLVVGKLSQQAGAIARGEIDCSGFVALPVKTSVLYTRIQSRLTATRVPSDSPVDGPISDPGSLILKPDTHDPIPEVPDPKATSSVPQSLKTEHSPHQRGGPTPASEGAAEPATGLPTPIRVLVVEDQPVNQKVVIAMLTKVLGKKRVSFQTAEDGVQGAEMATKDRSFDLILMDCQMPFMDGLECTRKIREWEAQRPDEKPYYIMAMTAHAAPDDLQDCLKAGMDDFCSKPLIMAVLKESLARFEKTMTISSEPPGGQGPSHLVLQS